MKDFSLIVKNGLTKAGTPRQRVAAEGKTLGRPAGALTKYAKPASWEKFCKEWLTNGGDEIAAAAHAGFENPKVLGPRLMQRAEVRRMLGLVDGHEPITARDLTPGLVKQKLAQMIKVNIADLQNDDGTFKKITELTRDQRAALVEVKSGAYGHSFKLESPAKTISLAADVLGLKHSTVAVEHSGTIDHKVNLDSIDPATLSRILNIADELPDEIIDAEYTDADT